MTEPVANRRPLASRDTRVARRAASWLVAREVTPNQISQLAMIFAALGFVCLALSWISDPLPAASLLLVAAACCQARLVCNLLDGMVAIEGGRAAKDGPFWNEAPDRVSDILFLCGAGVACGVPTLGALAAIGAVTTAYLRELGRAEGSPPDFKGPMAKQHRMALLTAGCVAAAVLPVGYSAATILVATLSLMLAGLGVTILLRARRLTRALSAR